MQAKDILRGKRLNCQSNEKVLGLKRTNLTPPWFQGLGFRKNDIVSNCTRAVVSLFSMLSILFLVTGCAVRDAPAASESLALNPSAMAVRKGVWLSNVGSSVFKDRKELKNAIQVLHELGINTIYPVVWNKGLTTYNSKVVKDITGLASDPQLGGRSILAEIFSILEETGIKMEVIPWFEYGLKVFVGLSEAQAKLTLQGPADQLAPEFRFAHEMHKRGLLARMYDGEVIWHDKHIQATYAFLDPSKKQARDIIVGLVEEVTRNFPVSGIQFDDHFSAHFAFGGVPESWNPNSKEAPSQERHFYWKRYMIGEIIHLASQISDAARRNGVTVRQISPAGGAGFSKRIWMQDWQTFLKSDSFNELVVQAYRDNLADFQEMVSDPNLWRLSNKNLRSVGIFTGTGRKPRPTDLIVSQIEVARNRRLGVNFFYYDSLVLDQSGNLDHERMAKIKAALEMPWRCHDSLKSLCGD